MLLFFFFNDTATTEIYTLSLHDALPIYLSVYQNDIARLAEAPCRYPVGRFAGAGIVTCAGRSEEHTSELQSH